MSGVNLPRTHKHGLVNNNYGSRRGFIRHFWHKFLYSMWFYRNYQKIDLGSVDRLVFVCKGNICRSAFAEVVARSGNVDAISCGLDAIEAVPADKKAIKMAAKLGFTLEEHLTTPVSSVVMKENDLFVAMEPWQAEYLVKHYPDTDCTLLGIWEKPVRPYIHDPYSSVDEYFENCFQFIKKSVDEITGKIKKRRN